MATKPHGGTRKGAGRKPAGTRYVQVRLTPGQHKLFSRLGGSAWMQQTLERTMTNIENTLKTIFDEDESVPEQFTDAYWRVTDPKQIAKLGLTQDEAAQVAKEVRRLADEEIEKRAAGYLKEARRDYDDVWARLRAFSPMYENALTLSEEDENEDWWTQEIKDKVINGVCADWYAVKGKTKFVFERYGESERLTKMSLEDYCERYDLKNSLEEVDDVLDFDTAEDALIHIKDLEDSGEIDAETAAEMREEVSQKQRD